MKKTFLIFVVLLFNIWSIGFCQNIKNRELSTIARLLFSSFQTNISTNDQEKIAALCNLKLSANKKTFILEDAPDAPYRVAAFLVDLNQDKIAEVFVLQESSYFGSDGVTFSLFTKDSRKEYHTNFSNNGYPIILSTKANNFADLLLGGGGFTQPIWRFNGKTYTFQKNVKDGSVKNSLDLETACKQFLSKP